MRRSGHRVQCYKASYCFSTLQRSPRAEKEENGEHHAEKEKNKDMGGNKIKNRRRHEDKG